MVAAAWGPRDAGAACFDKLEKENGGGKAE